MVQRERLYFVQGVIDTPLGKLSDIDTFKIGSCDVNGTIRKIFNDCKSYKGAVLVASSGVDIVASGHEILLPDNIFDLTLPCEYFEHQPGWIKTFQNMHWMTIPDGNVVITCESRDQGEHGTSRTTISYLQGTSAAGIDCHRNLDESDFFSSPLLAEIFLDYKFWYIKASSDLYFIGRKRGTTTISDISQGFSPPVYEINTISARHRIKLRQLFFRISRFSIDILISIFNARRFQHFLVT
jgi:hypothetical protein